MPTTTSYGASPPTADRGSWSLTRVSSDDQRRRPRRRPPPAARPSVSTSARSRPARRAGGARSISRIHAPAGLHEQQRAAAAKPTALGGVGDRRRRGRPRCGRASCRSVAGRATAPPPSARTPSCLGERAWTTRPLELAEAASPSSTKMSATAVPAAASTSRRCRAAATPEPGRRARCPPRWSCPPRRADERPTRGRHRGRSPRCAAARGWRRGSRGGCAPSRRRCRRRTSPGTASASTSATIASATTPAAGTAHTSERWLIASAASPVATSTVSSARGTVRDRLHRGPHPQDLTGGHAALGAAGAAGAPAERAVARRARSRRARPSRAGRRCGTRRRPRRP